MNQLDNLKDGEGHKGDEHFCSSIRGLFQNVCLRRLDEEAILELGPISSSELA
jgi:hypothetical protein